MLMFQQKLNTVNAKHQLSLSRRLLPLKSTQMHLLQMHQKTEKNDTTASRNSCNMIALLQHDRFQRNTEEEKIILKFG